MPIGCCEAGAIYVSYCVVKYLIATVRINLTSGMRCTPGCQLPGDTIYIESNITAIYASRIGSQQKLSDPLARRAQTPTQG